LFDDSLVEGIDIGWFYIFTSISLEDCEAIPDAMDMGVKFGRGDLQRNDHALDDGLEDGKLYKII
jgi:hypothetical protein